VRRFAVLLAWVLALAAPWAGRAQPVPLVVDADRVTYDAVQRTVEASGHVRLSYRDVTASAEYLFADLARREVLLRGDVRVVRGSQRLAAAEVRYNLETEELVATEVRALAEAAYLRAGRAVLAPARGVVTDALATLCDPASPLFHLTARRVTVFWADRLVAEEATLWVGGAPVLTVPRYEVRIDPERARRDFPSVQAGYDALSGYWVALRYPYRLGDVEGEASGRYNTASAFEFRNVLRAGLGGGRAELTAGTLRDSEGRPVDALQLHYALQPWQLAPGTSLSARVLAGQYRERVTGAQGLKAEVSTDLGLPRFDLGGPWSAGAGASLRYSVYEDRSLLVPAVSTSVDVRLSPRSSAYLAYGWTEAYGSTPFLFDAPTRQSALTVGYRQAGEGLAFDVGAQYDAVPRHLRLLATVDASLAGGWSFRTFAKYNATLASFEELELRAGRLCDCLEVSVLYRVPQQQLWLTVQVVPSVRVQQAVPEPLR
jgi:hypothetical protein